MSNKNVSIKKLKKIVDKEGAAQVAVWLCYKDTRAILAWLNRKRIPSHMELLVNRLINDYEKGVINYGNYTR